MTLGGFVENGKILVAYLKTKFNIKTYYHILAEKIFLEKYHRYAWKVHVIAAQ